jgi:hypothetical protein
MLGHASIETTDRYLNARRMGLHDSMRRYGTESGNGCKPVANDPPIEHRSDCNGEDNSIAKVPVH